MSEREEKLFGGNVAESVVRVGSTVRKPWAESTPSVGAFLEYLYDAGFSGAPRWLGRDNLGRQMLEYIPGATITNPETLTVGGLRRIGALVRELHDASRGFVPPPDARWRTLVQPDGDEIVCHRDLSPWNLVQGVDRWVFIDWDEAGSSTVIWDLAHAAHSFVPLNGSGEPAEDSVRLRSFADGYGLDAAQRKALPEKMTERIWAGVKLLEDGARAGIQPWVRLYAEDHGVYWRRVAEYVERHASVWRDALMG